MDKELGKGLTRGPWDRKRPFKSARKKKGGFFQSAKKRLGRERISQISKKKSRRKGTPLGGGGSGIKKKSFRRRGKAGGKQGLIEGSQIGGQGEKKTDLKRR